MLGDNAFPTLADASRQLEAGQATSAGLTEMLLERIAVYDGRVNSYLLVTADAARAEAAEADVQIKAGRRRGPLHGVPVAYKDIYETAGVRTTGHSRSLEGNVPTQDAATVAKMKAAGAVCLGKLATHEFAFGGPSFDLPWPPARNPWDTERFTGGSSSGTAAAITAGLALGGFGSDTGGSIRLPAAFSGLVGIKPTYGLISRRGVMPLSYSLDHAGPMAWTSEDCALLLEVMAGHDPLDPGSADVPVKPYASLLERDIKGLRIGVLRHFWEEAEATPETVAALEAALDVYRGLGAEIVEVTLSPLRDHCACCSVILMSEAIAVHEGVLRDRPESLGMILRQRLRLASLLSAADYVQALRRRRELVAESAAAFESVDLMFTATTPAPAPRLDDMGMMYTFAKPLLTMPFNVTGAPAIATRAGVAASGLPLSFQLVGRPFEDDLVLAAAHAYEQATDWAAARPQLEPMANVA
jgi:aspartyl-tRNA(Asn)/glutamyl-tRNA(Gln) amidotransferase subunit A